MADILSNTGYIYSNQNKGSFPSVMESYFPLFFLKEKVRLKYFFEFQLVTGLFKQTKREKKFSLKTVMEPKGSITHCYAQKRTTHGI